MYVQNAIDSENFKIKNNNKQNNIHKKIRERLYMMQLDEKLYERYIIYLFKNGNKRTKLNNIIIDNNINDEDLYYILCHLLPNMR
jgi:K+-sensing histidine kinase KdpD